MGTAPLVAPSEEMVSELGSVVWPVPKFAHRY